MSSSADIHAARIAERAAAAASDAPQSPRSRLDSFRAQRALADAGDGRPPSMPSPRSRLDSFRKEMGKAPEAEDVSDGGFQLSMPAADLSAPSIPALGLGSMSAAQQAAAAGSAPLSSRRLKKEVLKAETANGGASNSAGTITLRDELGTPRSARVVQSQEFEDFNMVSVKWMITDFNLQVELRHGRKSGIRKIYVNKELVERTKSMSNFVMDRGSTHQFPVGDRRATITIEKAKAGFKYFLAVDGEEIERDLGISAAGLSTELGTHFVRPQVGQDGFGMTLANCGQRSDGVVVLELEPGFPAHQSGLLVGDIILSVGEESEVDTNVIIEKLSNVVGEVILEIAGNSPSRLVTIPNPHAAKDGANGSLTLSDTACGVGVLVTAVEQAASLAPTAGRLDVGDIILSVDGAVTESAKETTKYIARAPDPLTFVVAGRELMVGMEPLPVMGA